MPGLLATIARNSFFSVAGKLSLKIISFAFTFMIIRWLGHEDYGRYALIWSYVVVFSIIADVGLDQFVVCEIAGGQPGNQYVVGNSIVLRFLLALVAFSLVIGVTWLSGFSKELLFQIFLASLILLLYAVQDPLDAALRAHERFDSSTLAIGAGLLIFIGAGVTLLLRDGGITGIIVARLLSVVVTAMVTWRLLGSYRRSLQWGLQPRFWSGYIRASLPFGLNKVWLEWALRIDIIILAWFWPDEVVGWYSAAYAFLLGIVVIANAVNAALLPTLSRSADSPSTMVHIYELALKYQLLLMLPLAGALSLLAGYLVIGLYGPAYAPSAIALSAIIWLLPIVSISEFLRYVLLVLHRERLVLQTLLLTALIRVALLIWLVAAYSFWGAIVAAITSETILLLIYLKKVKVELKSVKITPVALKPTLATVGAGAVFVLLFNQGVPIAVAIGGLTYLFLVWLLGAVQRYEIRQLRSALSNYQGEVSMTNIEDTTKPLASIFIPTYNGGRFLAQAIDSVLAQTYSDYELIILDDGSTDNTPTVLRQYESHPKIRIYTNPQNMGMAPNWNLGLSLCRGKYVAKLDVDDYYEPDYLETVISFFETHPDVGLVFSGLNLIYPDGRREPEIPFLRSWVKTREAFLPNLLQSCMIRSPTICVRKTCYDRLGGFIESMRLHPDWEMWVRISANCAVGYIARRLANYRMSYGQNCTSQSITQGWSIQDIQLWLELLASNKLPYQFNTKEDFYFRWGIYNLEMQFAAIAADHHEEAIRQQYIDFAESALPYQESKAELEEMRVTYAHLHQGIYAFRENKLAEACQYFFAAVKPQHLSQIRLKLTLSYKVIWRVAADLFYYYFVKYCPGL